MKIILTILTMFIFSGCSDRSVDSNPLFNQQWSINEDTLFYEQNDISEKASINSGNVLNRFSGNGVKVAIIDDGFDINHPEIRDKIIKTVSINENGEISDDVSHLYRDDYHGTAVAGIIAAANNDIGLVGLASNVELILIQMPAYLSDAITIELFSQAVDAGADVINCSWGTDDVSESVTRYIDDISTNARGGKGVIVVFASGNADANMGNDESAIDSVVGVGATDKTALRTSYSNFGKDLDIMAPGGLELGIATIDPVGSAGVSDDEYILYNQKSYGLDVSFVGTSASAPIITGAIALALEKDRRLTRVEIQELLKESTTTVGNNTPYIDDMICSGASNIAISGIYGQAGYSELYVRLTSYATNKIYGMYEAQSSGYSAENEEWVAYVTDILPNDKYYIEVISLVDNTSVVWATDTDFIVDSSKITRTDKSKRRSDFYGYGKLDLEKLIDNI